MLVGLGVVLLVTGVLCEEQSDVVCDLVLGGAVKISPDPKSKSFYNIDGLKIVRADESTAIVTGHVSFLKDFQKNFMVRIVIIKEKWGKTWTAMSYDICDFCAELNNEESPFKIELDALDFPRECPFKPGQFNVYNLTVNTENFPINSANEGNYEAELCLYAALDKDCSNIDRQGCVILPFIIECS